ncbi:MAG: NUDIX hydrolase [Acidimicrobiia bacterium]|nr:NUDIX hydrolase [Acidimicrobiia bacterium]NNF64052.1 NUDIX hydrolase [Acidimicrobiia bacterium]
MIERVAPFRQLLGSFEPASGSDVAKSKFAELIESVRDPFDEHNYRPGHITASGFVLSPDASALLLIHHRRLGMWLQPGGHVDPVDVDVLAAARREVAEETAVSELVLETPGIFDLDVHPIPGRSGVDPHYHYDVSFLFRAPSWDMAAADEVLDARWVAIDEASAISDDRPLARVLAWLGAG